MHDPYAFEGAADTGDAGTCNNVAAKTAATIRILCI